MESIASFKYPAARPLFVYIKGAHLKAVPGLKEFVAEYTRESTWGPQGYLVRRGLVPMDTAARQRYAKIAGSLAPLALARGQSAVVRPPGFGREVFIWFIGPR